MKKNLLLVIVGLVALVSLIFNLKSLQSFNRSKLTTKINQMNSKVTNVVDGDTFDVEI